MTSRIWVLGWLLFHVFGTSTAWADEAQTSATSTTGVRLVHERRWNLGANDDQSLFAIGNGRMLAYLKGPQIEYVWGPPYTSPNLTQMRLESPAGQTGVSSREIGAGIWHHRLSSDGRPSGSIVDFADAEMPVLVRMIDTSVPLTLHAYAGTARQTDTSSRYPGRKAMLCTHPVGVPAYGYRFCSNQPMSIQVVAEGAARMLQDAKGNAIVFEIPAGKSVIYIVGGPELPDCMAYTDMALNVGAVRMLERTRDWWRGELSRLRVPGSGELHDRLALIAEDVAVNLITQQASEGAVLAGHNFCLGYVRDQFGVARGFLDLGLEHRARQILEFYWRVFQKAGVIHNAQSIGGWPYFHVHENDDVEMTAYLIQQAMEYGERTGDRAFVRGIFPMLEWAFRVQERHLVKEMLPFNGDETYIAGTILPRSCMDHGSAEATYLFFASGVKLADWAQSQGLWTSNQAADARRLCERARSAYRENFVAEGRLMLNAPARAEGLVKPRFRHGVCQARHEGCLFFGWLEQSSDGQYCCERCYLVHKPAPPDTNRYYLPSVALTPLFIGSPIDEQPTTMAELDAALKEFRRPDGQLGYGSRRLPGYELGILLFAMSELNHPEAGRMAELLTGLRDSTGAWVEYYEGGKPQGTRYRPWESAINYSALVRRIRDGR